MFKSGDVVEFIKGAEDFPGMRGGNEDIRRGVVGEIVRFHESTNCSVTRNVERYWIVHVKGRRISVAEHILRLIPGGSESRQRGSWDALPWSPYRVSEEAVARAVSEATARLRLAVKW